MFLTFNISINDSTVNGTSNVGTFAGSVINDAEVINCSISNVTIGNKDSNIQNAGGFVGSSSTSGLIFDNTACTSGLTEGSATS